MKMQENTQLLRRSQRIAAERKAAAIERKRRANLAAMRLVGGAR